MLVLLLGVCTFQSLIIALAQHYLVPGARVIQPLSAAVIPPLAWLAYLTTVVRGVRIYDLFHLLGPLAAVAAIMVVPGFLDVLLPAAFVSYGAIILAHALKGADAQPRALLAHGNLPSRVWLIIGAALILSSFSDGLILLAQMTGRGDLQPWIVTVFSVGNLLLIGVFGLSPSLKGEAEEEADELPSASGEPDAELWGRVSRYMEFEKPYLDPNLTLSRLARKLRVPAKSLSTTINLATGENVSRYVNNARISYAQEVLLEDATVTDAMLSSGFNTKSNFNREFLRVTGTNPSAWLQKQRPITADGQ